jgi:hypothetical protein
VDLAHKYVIFVLFSIKALILFYLGWKPFLYISTLEFSLLNTQSFTGMLKYDGNKKTS